MTIDPGDRAVVLTEAAHLALAAEHAIFGPVTAHAPTAVAACLAAVTRGINVSTDEGLAIEAAWFASTVESKGVAEGLDRFLSRRARPRGGRR